MRPTGRVVMADPPPIRGRPVKRDARWQFWRRWDTWYHEAGHMMSRLVVFQTPLCSLMVHRIHRGEPEELGLHSHAWPFLSLIFGSYLEERLDPRTWRGTLKRRRFLNLVPTWVLHRVVHVDRPTLTIVLTGPKLKEVLRA